MLERVLEVKADLEKLVLLDSWKSWSKRRKFGQRAAAVEKMVKSKSFWAAAKNLVTLLE